MSDTEGDGIAYYAVNWGDEDRPSYYYHWNKEGKDFVNASHTYFNEGIFTITVRAADDWDYSESEPSTQIVDIEYGLVQDGICVKSNREEATFTITGPNDFTFSGDFVGQGGSVTISAKPGTYTIEFGNIDGFTSPQLEPTYLAPSSSITFDGEYIHKTGTIVVNTNSNSASFTINGSGTANGQNFTGSGENWEEYNAYVGDHTITFDPISGYYLPPINGQTQHRCRPPVV